MKRHFLSLLILTSYFLLHTSDIFASDKNIFGLHLTQISDINLAKNIINSSGGDWGYVTIVLPLNQMDQNAWQDFFNNCRLFHLIPIVRLATIIDNGQWKQPSLPDIDNLVSFLHALNWPTTQKHVILFNEINHASEWGGGVDVKRYVDLSLYAAARFKSLDPHFFLLGAGLDLAAPTKGQEFLSAGDVYRQIYQYNSEYFNQIDGLASHSYPNHGYIGVPSDSGQHSIRGYLWEQKFIKNLGVAKTYPVFITETGWPHREGVVKDNRFYSILTAANFLEKSIRIWSQDPQIVAVTPFIFNYPNEPFDHFSWLDRSESLYPQYQALINLPKSRNQPVQTNSYQLKNFIIPPLLFPNINYRGKITLTNTGQAIWGRGETQFCLKSISTANLSVSDLCLPETKIVPGQSTEIVFNFKIVDPKPKSYLQWETGPQYPIEAFYTNATIYHPNYTLWQAIKVFFTRI